FAVQNAIYLPIGKCDIAALQLRYDINPPRPAGHIACEAHIAPLKRYIANPQGFISLLTKNCLPKKAVLLLAISP
ncbi:MAG: hypothetical protein IKJ75_05645, partial [Clostridia bacterium]|nr:hypothetical protein [Clostridia bacterium]